MFLGRVKGHVVSTAKDPTIHGMKLSIVEPLKVDYESTEQAGGAKPTSGRLSVTGRAIVALDQIGAAEGQLVLIVQGSSARMCTGLNKTPTDAAIVGLVDEAVVGGKKIE